MTNFLDDETLSEMIKQVKLNMGRGQREKIGENTYEIEGLNEQLKADIDWLQSQQSKTDPNLRTTKKVVDRYGTK